MQKEKSQIKNILLQIDYISKDVQRYINKNTSLSIIREQPVTEPAFSILTVREKSILKLIATGFTNIEIADKLFISIDTVKTHRKKIKKKLAVTKLSELIKLGSTIN